MAAAAAAPQLRRPCCSCVQAFRSSVQQAQPCQPVRVLAPRSSRSQARCPGAAVAAAAAAGAAVTAAPALDRRAVATAAAATARQLRTSTSSSTTSSQRRRRGAQGLRPAALSGPGATPRVLFFGGGGRRRDPDLTCAKLQVGVFGDIERFQAELDRIAGLLDSGAEDAMGDLVHDVAVLLTRSVEYCGYAHTALFLTDDLDELEQRYNSASLAERAKFKAETLANVGGRVTTAALRETGADVGLDRWLCVTLLVAVEATLKLPRIKGLADLQRALTMLGGVPPDLIVAAELLWTPQERGDAYAKDEMLADYPKLATL